MENPVEVSKSKKKREQRKRSIIRRVAESASFKAQDVSAALSEKPIIFNADQTVTLSMQENVVNPSRTSFLSQNVIASDKSRTWVEKITSSKKTTRKLDDFVWSPIKSLIEAHNILYKLLGPKRLYWEVAYQLSIAVMLISARYYAENYFNATKIALDKYIGSSKDKNNSFGLELSLFYSGLLSGCLNAGLDFLARKFEMRNKSLAMDAWQKQHYSDVDIPVALRNGNSYTKKVRPYYDMSHDPNSNVIMRDAPMNVGKMVRTSSEVLIKSFAAIVTGAASISFLAYHSNFRKPFSAENIIGSKLLFACVVGLLTAMVNKKYTKISNDTIPLRQMVQTDEHAFNGQAHAIAALKGEMAVENILSTHQDPVIENEHTMVFYQNSENLISKIAESIDPALNYLLVKLNSQNPNVNSLPALLFALVNSSVTLYLKNKLTGPITELNAATKGLEKYYKALESSTKDNPDLHIFCSPDQNRTVKLEKGLTLSVLDGKGGKRKILNLRNDIYFEQGQIILISGESGRGKTRLINTLARLYQPQIEAVGKITFAADYNLNNTLYLPQVNLSLPNTTFLQRLAFPMIPEEMCEDSRNNLIKYAKDILQKELESKGFDSLFNGLNEPGGLYKQCDLTLSGGEQKTLQAFWIIRDGAIKNGYLEINTKKADKTACPLVLLDEIFVNMNEDLILKVQACLKKAWTIDDKLMATFLSIEHPVTSVDFYNHALMFEGQELNLNLIPFSRFSEISSSSKLNRQDSSRSLLQQNSFSPIRRQITSYPREDSSEAIETIGLEFSPENTGSSYVGRLFPHINSGQLNGGQTR